ncbi:MAG: cytochrome ubiquinol oxidase subunit I [Desulfovibrionaceae bacterium]
MEYPVWHLYSFGGGFLVALIAVVHVYVAHFAVGGGLFLVLTEHLAYRRGSSAILDYVKRHAKFFLLLTMVFGGLTGVGIWLVISVLSPRATSLLIHTFVFGWATEWVCFLAEITALLVYYYGFSRLSRRDHLAAGWLYFLFAWLSLFLITGIIDFMLTPGEWLASRNFWDGFFNPSFWPSVAFRTFLSMSLAGVYGFVTAVGLKDEETREAVLRYTALWSGLPFLLVLASGFWYLHALPPDRLDMILQASPEIAPYLKAFPWLGLLIAAGGLLMAFRFLPKPFKIGLASVLLVLGLLYTGAFEFVREAGRRPYLVTGLIYSNSIMAGRERELQTAGALAKAKWTPFKKVTEENRLQAGDWLFQMQCASCHSVDGALNDIRPLTQGLTAMGLQGLIFSLGDLSPYMPPFMGTPAEAGAVADYAAEVLHGMKSAPEEREIEQSSVDIPTFDADSAEYVLLAVSGVGMRLVSDCDGRFLLSPPGTDLSAVLLRRDGLPELVSEGVVLRYAVEPGYRNPADRVPFWRFAEQTLGRTVPANKGLAGAGLNGTMAWDETSETFKVQGVPVVPYTESGGFDPYPLARIEAVDAKGRTLAETKVVLPASTEMGCNNCHGGGWRRSGAGISNATAENVLQAHDRKSGTALAEQAAAGHPQACSSCHPDEPSSLQGEAGLLGLSAAIHGLHAHYFKGQTDDPCGLCHATASGGLTQGFRGLHAGFGFGCSACHGDMADHAIALLKAEQNAGKKRASELIQGLKPETVKAVAEIKPRRAWIQEPDCLGCHTEDFIPPDLDATAFNKWTEDADGLYRNRKGDLGRIPCAACHGAQHAVYAADNPYGSDRDNIQPLQYMGEAGAVGFSSHCAVCHIDEMDFSAHHPGMLP